MRPHRQIDNSYRGYEREKIDANPVLKLAWIISQIKDDTAPMNWWKHVSLAECLMDWYDIKELPVDPKTGLPGAR